MLWPVVVFVVVIMIASRRVKGPLWATCIAWLISLVPIMVNIIDFASLTDPDYRYSLVLIGLIGSYAAGAGLFHLMPHTPPRTVVVARASVPSLTIVWLCWAIGLIGAGLVIADFVLFGGAGLSDLAALRDAYIGKTGASLPAQLGAIMTWACLYSYIFVLLYRQWLGPLRSVVLVLPIVGYFLLSLLSAGRQAAFQMMLATVLTTMVAAARRRRRSAADPARAPRSRVLIASVSALMVSYMGYVAVARNDGAISDDKTEVLLRLFDFKLPPAFETLGNVIGPSLRAVIVEGLVYFSGSIPLFQQFLRLDLPLGFGASTAPMIMRQLQSLTGISQAAVAAQLRDGLDNLGFIGAGWTTAFSSYISDFGPVGAVVFLFLSGFYSAYAWQKAVSSDRFEDIVIGILAMLFGIYMPLFPSLQDNNLLFLWIVCLGLKAMRGTARTAIPATA